MAKKMVMAEEYRNSLLSPLCRRCVGGFWEIFHGLKSGLGTIHLNADEDENENENEDQAEW